MDSMIRSTQGEPEEIPLLDEEGKSLLTKVLDERISGKYKDDREGFIQRLIEVFPDLSFDPHQKAKPEYSFDLKGPLIDYQEDVLNVSKDKKRLTIEIAD